MCVECRSPFDAEAVSIQRPPVSAFNLVTSRAESPHNLRRYEKNSRQLPTVPARCRADVMEPMVSSTARRDTQSSILFGQMLIRGDTVENRQNIRMPF
jgi:hypothetical protein